MTIEQFKEFRELVEETAKYEGYYPERHFRLFRDDKFFMKGLESILDIVQVKLKLKETVRAL